LLSKQQKDTMSYMENLARDNNTLIQAASKLDKVYLKHGKGNNKAQQQWQGIKASTYTTSCGSSDSTLFYKAPQC
jgi:hypothetical protein